MRQRRPDHVVEQRVIDLVERQIVRIVVRAWRGTADIRAPFRPEIHARRIDQQRAVGKLRRRRYVEDAAAPRIHGDVDPHHRGQRTRPRAGCIDQRVARVALAVLRDDVRDPAAVAHDIRHVGRDIARAERLRLLAQRLHEPVAVEPAFAAGAVRARHEIVDVQPGEFRAQCVAVHQPDIGAEARLQRMVLAQRRIAGRRREKQVAAFVQIDRRPVAVHFEPLAERTQKLDPEQRHLDRQRCRKLLTDRGGRQRRRRLRVRRIALDDGHGDRRIGGAQKVGDRAADHATADDDDLRTHD